MAQEAGLVLDIKCPRCGRQLRHPFPRHSGPVAYRHRIHGQCDTRLIVYPHRRLATEIPADTSTQTALSRALAETAVA